VCAIIFHFIDSTHAPYKNRKRGERKTEPQAYARPLTH